MTLPTRDQLNLEVDHQFFEQHPDAPRRLDPDDPAQADLVTAWLAIRDHVLNEWTDTAFREFFPNAGRLDPGNSADGDMIAYWWDIHDQIRDGQQGKWSWDNAQPALELVTVEQHPSGRGFVLKFNRTFDVGEVARYIWRDGSGPGGIMTDYGTTTPGEVHLEMGFAALQQMNDDVARRVADASVMSTD